MKIVTLIGTRPQIIKSVALSRAIQNQFSEQIQQIIVHTGQHYDKNMSQVFIDELGVPKPDYNLKAGSASHAVQTAKMIPGIEAVLLKEKPDFLVIYGDTNSTLAGAVAASKIHIPIAHVEAGLRSFNKTMPEEINRIMADHASTLLFSPTAAGIKNLIQEGFKIDNLPPYSPDHPGIFRSGDVMYDNTLYFEKIALEKGNILQRLKLENKPYYLATVHRDNNTDQPQRLSAIFGAFQEMTLRSGIPLVLPLHPRTSKLLKKNLDRLLFERITGNPLIHIIPPVSYLEMLQLEKNCEMIFTDSGGVQKEAYFFKKPVVILRSETEWIEILEQGCGIVANAFQENILEAADYFKRNADRLEFPPLYGDGHAADFIAEKLFQNS